MKYPHSGQCIKDVILTVLDEYNITDALMYIAFDNASNNLKCIRSMREDTDLMNRIILNEYLHGRRIAHILNLPVQCALKIVELELQHVREV